MGNLTSNVDVCSYTNPAFGYDVNGNLLDGSARSTTTIRTYVAGLGFVEEKFAGTGLPSSSSGTRNARYFLADHLGSPLAVVDDAQAVLQRMSYDPWGRRRNADGTDDASASLGSIVNTQDHSGYTGQEQLDQLGLVHLNGRVYDPITARMTSADPSVPDPHDGQHLNRYSYVTNNALAFVDPSGFSPYMPQTAADPWSTGAYAATAWGPSGCSGITLLCGRWRPQKRTEIEAGGAGYWSALSMADLQDDLGVARAVGLAFLVNWDATNFLGEVLAQIRAAEWSRQRNAQDSSTTESADQQIAIKATDREAGGAGGSGAAAPPPSGGGGVRGANSSLRSTGENKVVEGEALLGAAKEAAQAGTSLLPKGITQVKNAKGEVFKEVHTPPSRPHAGMAEHTHPNYRNVLPDGTVRTGVSRDGVPVSRRDIIDATRPGAQRTGVPE